MGEAARSVMKLVRSRLDDSADFVTFAATLQGPPSALIMSAVHNDEELLARHHMRKEQQDKLIADFKDRDKPPQFLIVCDMLLTGFDAPVEQVMYLDTPLREHNLLQAIARTNRTMEGKTHGLIVDYWGVAGALEDALEVFAAQDVEQALSPRPTSCRASSSGTRR